MCDYAYYRSVYGGCLLEAAQWPAARRQALAFLDGLTFGRLRRAVPDDTMRMAVCAVAEAAGRWQSAEAQQPAGLKAANNDGYSESYADDTVASAACRTAMLDAADLYLPRSHPLRYAGGDDGAVV